jgi:hypothetical protein
MRLENLEETKMNLSTKAALATAFFGLLFGASPAALAEQSHYVSSNAVDKCQAFTPGVTNTIRNRVSGAENVGTQAIAVACVFELSETYGMSSAIVDDVSVYIKNGSSSPMTVNCSLLPGDPNNLGTLVTKSVDLAAGETSSIDYGTGDTGAPWSVFGIGVNCSVPPKAIITETVIRYRNDN